MGFARFNRPRLACANLGHPDSDVGTLAALRLVIGFSPLFTKFSS
jgi:hypothetical protein